MKALQFTKTNGVVTDESGVVRQLNLWLHDAMNGDYTLTLERTPKSRTSDQNRLMWVWFTCLAESLSEATGRAYTRENMHDYFCTKYLPVTVNGVNVPGKTRGLTTERMSKFLDQVRDEASRYGITLYSINDSEFVLWAKQYGY